MTDFQKAMLASIIRHGLTVLSGYLIAQHVLTGEQANSLIVAFTNYFVDAVPLIGAMVWSYAHKASVN